MLVNLGGGYAQTIVRAATLRQKPQIKFAVSLGHGRPTPRKPVPRLVLQRQVWELLDTNFEVYGVTRSGKNKQTKQNKPKGKAGIEPRSASLEADGFP